MDTISLLERAESLGWPSVSQGGGYTGVQEGERAWRAAVPTLNPAERHLVGVLLEQERQRRERTAEVDERTEYHRHVGAVMRGEEDLYPDEQEQHDRVEAQARADHEEFERDRPKRIEALLGQLVAAQAKK